MQRARGYSLMEVTIAMATVSFGFLISMHVLKEMTDDMHVEMVQSDIHKRVTGRLYDMTGELEAIVASDSQFLVTLNGVTVADGNQGNGIAFRIPAGVNAAGAITWGKATYKRSVDAMGNPVVINDPVLVDGRPVVKLRYRWLPMPNEPQNDIDDDGNGIVDDGMIIREELDDVDGVLSTMLLEDSVPYRARIRRGEDPNFNQVLFGLCFRKETTNVRMLNVTVQRAADQRKATDDGTIAISSATRTLYLRNR